MPTSDDSPATSLTTPFDINNDNYSRIFNTRFTHGYGSLWVLVAVTGDMFNTETEAPRLWLTLPLWWF